KKILEESPTSYVKVLHARFIQKDRQLLEKELQNFASNQSAKGIWITTQIVEASMDIDFDKLFTELAPLDSLFQRFGRCYRKRNYNAELPNIKIFTEETSGTGSVYDADILRLSKEMLKNHLREHGSIMYESMKMKM